MTLTNKSLVSKWRLLAGLLLCVFILTACGKGPFSPEARSQAAARDLYLAVLRTNLVTDDTFEFSTMSSAIIVHALPFNQMVREAADSRFASSPDYSMETHPWFKPTSSFYGESTVVLMGLYTPDLADGDLTILHRFRPRLLTSEGRLLEPLEIKDYGKKKAFMRDHFPVFNPWEKIYMIKFPATKSAEHLTFQLVWPGGVQSLELNKNP